MIKVSGTQATVRETTAPYTHNNDNGEVVTEEIRVRYKSWTIFEMKRKREAALKKASDAQKRRDTKKKDGDKKRQDENPEIDEVVWLSDLMIDRIDSLPDLSDENGKPFEITKENLEKLDVGNLAAMRDAIDEDIAGGKSQPAK